MKYIRLSLFTAQTVVPLKTFPKKNPSLLLREEKISDCIDYENNRRYKSTKMSLQIPLKSLCVFRAVYFDTKINEN